MLPVVYKQLSILWTVEHVALLTQDVKLVHVKVCKNYLLRLLLTPKDVYWCLQQPFSSIRPKNRLFSLSMFLFVSLQDNKGVSLDYVRVMRLRDAAIMINMLRSLLEKDKAVITNRIAYQPGLVRLV